MKSIRLICSGLAIALITIPFAALVAHGAGNPVLEKVLGAALFNDEDLSKFRNQACVSCHHPSARFADPDNTANPVAFPVSDGSDPSKFGGRNAPTASYAGFSPKLHWDGELFIGGLFWDGRASGQDTTVTAGLGAGPTGDPLADQAKGPFLNPVEMALLSERQVVNVVRSAPYAWLFEIVYPGVLYNNKKVGVAYNDIAIAIAAFERTLPVNKFNSKLDKFLVEQGGDVSKYGIEEIPIDSNEPPTLFRRYVGPGPREAFRSRYFSYEEAEGLALFNADSEVQLKVGDRTNVGGMCYLCHLTERHNPMVYGGNAVQPPNPLRADGTYPPMFTDFSYDNLGIPVNPRIAELAGPQSVDYGLGASGRVPELLALNEDVAIANEIATDEQGKFKVSTLRNIAKTAPYGHNGFFPDLKSIVHFYNTRDLGGFGAPEVPATVNKDELGDLGLSTDQEAKIVLFLKTLSD